MIMNEETLKDLYKNSCWLIKELANMFSKMKIKNNIFEIANENFENIVEKKT